MYAIVKTGGKQYRVAEGDVLEVEKLDAELGKTVELDVIFLADGSKVSATAEELEKAKVFATVVEHFRGDKALVFKFKKRKGYKRLRGHRQDLTRLLVQGISPTGVAPKAVADEKKPARAKKAAEDVKPAAKKASAPADDGAEKASAPKKTAAVKEPSTEKEPAAAKKPAATKKPAADKASDKAVADKTVAEEAAGEAAEKKPATTKKPAAEKKPAAAKKPAAKKTTADDAVEEQAE